MKRLLFPVVIGLGGLAILVWLGTWQIQRLGWKQDILAGIESRISADPIPLPAEPDPARDRYLPVMATGMFTDTAPVRMLASRRQIGAVFRNIAAFRTDQGPVILVDLGWTPPDKVLSDLPKEQTVLTGNLDWPNEVDTYTPAPDVDAGLWYARDIDTMAEALGTAPIMLVLRERPEPALGAVPWPVDTAGIPNDHLQYAITWFSLALIWVAMTAYFVLRTRRGDQQG